MNINSKTIERYVLEWTNEYISNDFEFREHQLEAIVDIIRNIVSDGNKNYIVEAPTGTGKSLINIISAGVLWEYFKMNSYILVSDLFLWEQYDKFIKTHKKLDFASIKGQTGNYECKINHEDIRNADCRVAGISWAALFNKQSACSKGYDCAASCQYVKARRKAIMSNVCLMTYQLFLFSMNNPSFNNNNGTPIFGHRDIIFCDECHNIPAIVQNQYSPCIKKEDFQKLNDLYDYANHDLDTLFGGTSEFKLVQEFTRDGLNIELDKIWAQFTKQESNKSDDVKSMVRFQYILSLFTDVCTDIVSYVSNKKLNKQNVSKDDMKLFKLCTWFQNYGCFWSDFNHAISEAGDEYLLKDIVILNVNGDVHVSFKCTKEDYIVYRYLLSQAKYKVMLSATVGGKEAYDDNMGFKFTDDKESLFKVLPSNFDFTKSPIHFLNKFKMSFREKDISFQQLKKIIYSICETKFGDQRGMIQTGSYAFARQLYNDAPLNIKQRMLLYNGSREKTTCIKIHEISDNTILVGPSLNEGIDLPGDRCRFIIIMKVPYPSLADKLVKEKIKLFPLWYNSTTSNEIIQGIGRGVRYDGDWCVSYILDACFWKLYLDTQDQYSEEFKKRLNII